MPLTYLQTEETFAEQAWDGGGNGEGGWCELTGRPTIERHLDGSLRLGNLGIRPKLKFERLDLRLCAHS